MNQRTVPPPDWPGGGGNLTTSITIGATVITSGSVDTAAGANDASVRVPAFNAARSCSSASRVSGETSTSGSRAFRGARTTSARAVLTSGAGRTGRIGSTTGGGALVVFGGSTWVAICGAGAFT